MEQDDDMSADMKNDILLAFNLFKNENNKINKLKLRTMLFSFVMYKQSSGEINRFIEEETSPSQEFFTFDEVCSLVKYKLRAAKEKESDEIFNYFNVGKSENCNKLTEHDIEKAFANYEIDMKPEEIKEMMRFMNGDFEGKDKDSSVKVTRAQFKKFYTDTQ